MKKILTLTLLVVTLVFTGCGQDNPKKAKAFNSVAKYEIVAEDKYPVRSEEYYVESSTVTIYHSDIKEDVEEFKKSYRDLTGKEYKDSFQGTMIVARAGVKSNSGYKIRVESIKDSGRYTNVYLSVVQTKGCITSQTLTAPYTIAFVPNHKDVKFFIKDEVVECK
jgi:hypothetical protein